MSTKKYITSDEQVFTSKNYAILHSNTLGNKLVKEIGEDQEATADQTKVKPLLTNAKEIIDFITDCEDLDLIEQYKQAELDKNKPRVSVLDTIEARTEDITKEA
jgi:hypothetical protein